MLMCHRALRFARYRQTVSAANVS